MFIFKITKDFEGRLYNYIDIMIRIDLENIENQILSKYALRSAQTKGRAFPIEKCDLRMEFQRDRDRILHCKSFRRLKHKTQVFLAPEGDHYRTRLTHTLEVSQIARTISRALRLNEDLTEAIALGHDLGHTPFGHAGERALQARERSSPRYPAARPKSQRTAGATLRRAAASRMSP